MWHVRAEEADALRPWIWNLPFIPNGGWTWVDWTGAAIIGAVLIGGLAAGRLDLAVGAVAVGLVLIVGVLLLIRLMMPGMEMVSGFVEFFRGRRGPYR